MCGQGWPLLGSGSASLAPSSRRPSLAYGWGSPCVFTLSSFSVSKLPFLFFNFIRTSDILGSSVVAQLVRIHLQCRRPGFNPWVGKILWRREWLPSPVFLPGESHGQRSLTGYSPWGCKESDTTEATEHTYTRHTALASTWQLHFHFVTSVKICFQIRWYSEVLLLLSHFSHVRLCGTP